MRDDILLNHPDLIDKIGRNKLTRSEEKKIIRKFVLINRSYAINCLFNNDNDTNEQYKDKYKKLLIIAGIILGYCICVLIYSIIFIGDKEIPDFNTLQRNVFIFMVINLLIGLSSVIALSYRARRMLDDNMIDIIKNRIPDNTFLKEQPSENFHDSSNIKINIESMNNFGKSDGWILYSLSRKYNNLRDIISTGDYFNHAIFTYDELNNGLQRLIQNEYAEKMGTKFRITKKGRKFVIKKTHLFKDSITNMIKLSEIMEGMKTKIEADYSIPVISVNEYETALKEYLRK